MIIITALRRQAREIARSGSKSYLNYQSSVKIFALSAYDKVTYIETWSTNRHMRGRIGKEELCLLQIQDILDNCNDFDNCDRSVVAHSFES